MGVEASWARFLERMQALGERITEADFPDDPRLRAEGYRYLSRLSVFALQRSQMSCDERCGVR
jgi:hypothetical protein